MEMLYKEIKLSASPLSWFFIAASLLTLVPGYPILLGAFFTTLGIFYSFQSMRENNDISYALLLPVSKKDIVKGKYLFTVFVELCSFVPMTVITLIRMILLYDAGVYRANALMCANLTFLGFALLIFGLFNLIFVGGFFKTAYYFGKPFIAYCIVSLLVIVLAEALHHIPGMESTNAFGFENLPVQGSALVIGLVLFVILTTVGMKRSWRTFEKVDL